MGHALSRRTVLRAGYAGVVAVLVLSAVEAYRIQTTVSRQHLEIYRRYVDQDQALSTLRLNLWLAGNYVRDFFINTTPAQGAVLRSQIDSLKASSEKALRDLATFRSGDVPGLRRSMDEFWVLIDPIPQSMLHSSDKQQYDFVQREIVPRRGELYTAMRALTFAEQRHLQDSEGEFANSRREAAERLVIMLVVGVLMCFVVARLSLRHAEALERQAERNYAAVEQAKVELQQLSGRLLEIEEEGKRQLSRELHDEIGQSLALLQIEISRSQASPDIHSPALRDSLSRAHALAERTVQTIRNLAVLLRPALLDDLGLVPALHFLMEDFLRRGTMTAEFIEEGLLDHYPDSVNTCVYRVLQEALHNCEKHSGATRVKVTVRQLSKLLMLEVDDDGQGFELKENGMPLKPGGLGLLGIRERASLAGGTFVIDTAPGHGTRIALRIPLPSTVPSKPAGREVTV
jgi:signal transduction histidine kinase